MFVWFASGIVLMYYPWPTITESQVLAARRPFEPDSALIGFPAAVAVAERDLGNASQPVAGRLELIGEHPVYRLYRDRGGELIPAALVDGLSGRLLSPVPVSLAEAAAREALRRPGDLLGAGPGRRASPVTLELLRRGDHYTMIAEFMAQFPAYRVRFDDPERTAIYVNARGGNAFATVTRRTRLATWTGTVPHWFYFIWLYDRPATWNAAILVAASLVILLAITGIVWGVTQLLRRRPRRQGLSPYRGLSKWHHLSGLGFGVLVLTWGVSGIWQNLGEGSGPRAGQAARIRNGPTHWSSIRLSEAAALTAFRAKDTSRAAPIAIDLAQYAGRPGFEFHFPGGVTAWIDAEDGRPRGELDDAEERRAAHQVMGDSARIEGIDRLTGYDDYYYARHGRELHLPVARVRFGDAEGTRLYLDPVSGVPTGFVDRASKRARWLRDALHSFDYAALNGKRPLWDAVMLPLLIGGLLSSGSGLLMVARRIRRVRRRGTGQDAARVTRLPPPPP